MSATIKREKRKPLVRINYELYKRRINPRAIVLYHLLADGMFKDRHEVRIDKPSVAADLGVSVPTLMRYLRILANSGFLINKREKTASGMHKYIIVLKPVDVAPPKPKSEPPKPSEDEEKPVFAPVSTGATTRYGSNAKVCKPIDFKALDRVQAEGPETKFEKEIREEVELENSKNIHEERLSASASPTKEVGTNMPAMARSGETERVHAQRPQSEFEVV